MLAVIFIVSLVAALVMPSFGGFGPKGIRADARHVASLLRYLNESAVSMKETYPLRIDLGASSLSWKEPEGEKSERLGTLVSTELQSRGELKEGQVTVFFGPAGLQEFLKIKLRDEDRSITVAFNPISGRVKIIEDER
jgi:general secretion pathway protein H